MQDSSQEWERIWEPFKIVQRLMRTPSSTTTPAPMVTLGPIVQFMPILALGSWKGREADTVRFPHHSSASSPKYLTACTAEGINALFLQYNLALAQFLCMVELIGQETS